MHKTVDIYILLTQLSAPAQLPLFETERQSPRSRIGPAAVAGRPKSKVLVAGRGSTSDYDYTLNPYIGCSFGCSYCFAASFVADEEKKASWGTWVEVKEGALQELARVDLKGKSIFMSSATDPYQPLEKHTELTRSIVEFMSEPYRQPRLTVQTRSPLAARDIDLFVRYKRLRVNMSITTDSEEIRKRFEPGCASIDRRFEALEAAVSAGLPVTVCVCPMLPLENPAAFARRILALKPYGVATCFFQKSDRPFASNTRDGAWVLAKEFGWDRAAFERAQAEMNGYLGELTDHGRGFSPM